MATRALLRFTPVVWLALSAGCSSERVSRSESIEVPAPSLGASLIPNAPFQPALVLLPPGYDAGEERYPVVYYLPGFTNDVTEYVDGSFEDFDFAQALHRSIAHGVVRRLIVVIVNGRNALGGSFYVDSPVTGRWETYVVRDVVPFVDSRYRTLAEPGGRGVAGESMGGFGALHLAMRHPDVFGAVFALSPGLFDAQGFEEHWMLAPPYVEAWWKTVDRMQSWPRAEAPARLVALSASLQASERFGYRRGFVLAYGAAFAPAPQAGPPFVAYPIERSGGLNAESYERFRAGYGGLEAKVQRHTEALRALRGIGLDVGRNDHLAWIPRGARRLSVLLAQAGIEHRLTEHDGGHLDRLGERIETEMLPFFSHVLVGEKEGEDP